jgi:hypothetical protein
MFDESYSGLASKKKAQENKADNTAGAIKQSAEIKTPSISRRGRF